MTMHLFHRCRRPGLSVVRLGTVPEAPFFAQGVFRRRLVRLRINFPGRTGLRALLSRIVHIQGRPFSPMGIRKTRPTTTPSSSTSYSSWCRPDWRAFKDQRCRHRLAQPLGEKVCDDKEDDCGEENKDVSTSISTERCHCPLQAEEDWDELFAYNRDSHFDI